MAWVTMQSSRILPPTLALVCLPITYFAYSFTLQMEAVYSSKMLATTENSTPHTNSEIFCIYMCHTLLMLDQKQASVTVKPSNLTIAIFTGRTYFKTSDYSKPGFTPRNCNKNGRINLGLPWHSAKILAVM
jgi:hypothetical protein